MDNPRVPSDSFELAFFNLGTGAGECSSFHSAILQISLLVPVVAVLTKYEAFLDRAKSTLKERQGHEPNKKQILSYLDEQVMSNIEKFTILTDLSISKMTPVAETRKPASSPERELNAQKPVLGKATGP